MSEEFWGKVLEVVRYSLGGLCLLVLFRGWTCWPFRFRCRCSKCCNFKVKE